MEKGVERVIRLIERERDRANLSDRELERLAGLGRGTLTRIFARSVDPSTKSLKRLAEALGYSWLSFMALADDDPEQAQEHELIYTFRKLAPEGRDILLRVAESMYEKYRTDSVSDE